MEPEPGAQIPVPGQLSFLQTVSFKIVDSLERFFYHWGYNIATRPLIHIIACLIITIACGVGLLTFTQENRPDKLWIPWNSEFVRDTDWLNKNFPSPFRFHYAIITAEDVLQPEVLNLMLDIHNKVKDLKSPKYPYTWNDLCFRLPVIKFDNAGSRKRKRETLKNGTSTGNSNFGSSFDDFDITFDESEEKDDKPFDPSVTLPVDLYCSIVDSLDQECYESNMLELWSYNASVITSLSKANILEAMNNDQISPVFGRPVNYSIELGLVKRNETGHIVGAQAAMIRWFARLNRTAMDNGDVLTDEGTGQAVDKYNFLWEKELANFFQNYQPSVDGVTIYFNVARSFADISGSTIWNDAYKLAAGFSIVFMYVIFMLGKFNLVEQRPWLSLAGLSCVGLAIVCSYGICSAFRIIYGPVHNILPFLLMGIGIDDMFVIMQNWNNLSPRDSKKSLPEKLGLTLQHAGVSITVTSLTDFFAFAIGGTTVLPALQSFCIYAALGIVATYVFQATFFTACLAIDQRRIEQRRNAFFPCVVHPAFSPKTWKTKSIAQNVIQKVYCKYLFNKFTKAFVFILTLAMMGVNIWGNMLLRQEFNPIWFLPQDSYLFKYFAAREQYFPDKGEEGFVMMHEVDLKSNLPAVEQLMFNLENTSYIHELDAWYPNFKKYVNSNFGKDIPNEDLTEKEFKKYLGKFLFSPSGGKYQASFKFKGNLACGRPAPVATVSSMNFKFNLFSGPDEHIPAMRKIKGAIRNANFTPESSHGFVWSFAFAGWETDEIITDELYRNMGLAMICVFLTTLVLIANFRTCMMVLICVVLTLVDVGGSMHFWNLTIDTVSCIDLVLAIGLCVDYAAHIGHAFMTCVGTREERAQKALVNIGAAVLNGGFSTFLAFILLANSRSHVFTTFFKIFFLVVAYGLYHGLVFLPVLLSLIGPEPYATAVAEKPESNANLSASKEVQMLLVKNSHPTEGRKEDGLLSNEPTTMTDNAEIENGNAQRGKS